MAEDASFDYDDEFSLDFDDPLLDSQLDSYSTQQPVINNLNNRKQPSSHSVIAPISRQPPPIQPIAKRALLAPTQPIRNSQAILRPPQPPTKKIVGSNSNYRGGLNRSNGVVPANPFSHKVIPVAKKMEMVDTEGEEEEEEMPMIDIGVNGYIRSDPLPPPPPPPPRAATSTSTASNLNRRVVIGNRSDGNNTLEKGVGGRGDSNGNAVASTSKLSASDTSNPTGSAPVSAGLDSEEMRELRELRLEKALHQQSLLDQKTSDADKDQQILRRTGEITIVRKNLERTQLLLQQQTEAAQTAKRALEAKLEDREREYRREMEQLKVQTAFKNQEIETSAARRPTASQWSSTGRPRATSLNPGAMDPPAFPTNYAGSPSFGRSNTGGVGGKISAPTSTTRPAFLGFQNAFESPSLSSQQQSQRKGMMSDNRSRRSETFAPPALPIDRIQHQRKGLQTPVKGILQPVGGGSREKGKGRMMVNMTVEEEEEEENSRAGNDSMMVDESGFADESRMEDGDNDEMEDDVDMSEQEKSENDWRGEILSAIFTHTTFVHYDSESVTAAPISTQRPTASLSRSINTTRANAHSTFNHFTSTFTPNQSNLVSTPTSAPIDTSPIPTFHYLTNFRFPSNTPHSIVADYEDVCRDIFTLIGKRKNTVSYDKSFEGRELEEREEMYEFIRGLGIGLEGMIHLLEQAGTIGPLIPLLSLISTLVLLFPSFALYFLNDSRTISFSTSESKLLPLLARIIRRFGKPSIPVRLGEDVASSSNSMNDRGKFKERSRKLRLAAIRANAAVPKVDHERVDVEPVKRDSLVKITIEVLETLAWRLPPGEEKNFVQFLASPDTVSTLLDSNHAIGIHSSTIGFLTLLSTHTSLFRSIIGVPFSEVAGSKTRSLDCALFNRIGTLSARKKVSHLQSYRLDMTIITFVTSLLSKHDDAILLLTGSGSLLPELLQKLYQDVRTLWEYDGQDVMDSTLSDLKLVVKRLSSLVHFFYYLIGAPTSTFSIAEFLSTNKSHLGLSDRYNVAFGTLSYASLPDWAEKIAEGSILTTLSYLAQEIMEDVSPREAEEIESCFTMAGTEEEGEEEMMSGDEEERAFRQGLSQS